MRTSPSIVPDQDTYLVPDDIGPKPGRSWRQTDEAGANRASLIRNLFDEPYENLVAFNTVEGRSRDVTSRGDA
jgi:hypothetical protein